MPTPIAHQASAELPTFHDFVVATVADPTALFTALLAVATIALWLFTALMWLSTRNSVRLAHDEFNATHRPRLHVRNVVVKPSGAREWSWDAFAPGSPLSGQFYVANIGDAPAKVVESHCEILWGLENGLPMERPYEGKNGNDPVPRVTIASGSSTVGLFSSEETFPGVHSDKLGRTNVYVMGWIEYLDALGNRRRTGFCRRYADREGSLRFYPVNDPDYEYEE